MAPKGKPPPKKAAKKKNGYEMPKPLKPGDILNDNQKNQWKIGVSIGVGGFGEIYSACKVNSNVKKLEDYPFVVKIEPKENGPLFVEMHFYMRNAKLEDIQKFKNEHKLKSLGMPEFIALGSHEIEQLKHRFIVLPRFGRDISKIAVEQDHKFPLHTVYRLTWQIVNVLEYIHGCTYVHGDIKSSNILLGYGRGGEEQAYLLDFGLACHISTKEYKPDPKKMHNGTIEYTSRDAHHGVPTIRGDIEILMYNLIEWAGGKLPWVAKNLLSKPADVQKSKEEFMKSSEKSLKSCFDAIPFPAPLINFLKYLVTMNHDTVPDYNKIRGILEAGIKELGQKNSGILDFKTSKLIKPAASPQKKQKLSIGRPDFSTKYGDSPKKSVEISKPGPLKSSEAAPANKRNRGAKTYAEVLSDESDEEATKKKKPQEKKPTAAKTTKTANLAKDPEESRPEKRNRERKQNVFIDAETSEDEEPAEKKSPRKKAKKSPNCSTSKENSESSLSPPQKKAKAEGKKEKSSRHDEAKAEKTITLKSKTKSSKNKKTIHLNVNLDVSMNSDVVVVFNRKDKKKKKNEDTKTDDEEAANSDENKPETPNRAGFYKGKQAKAK